MGLIRNLINYNRQQLLAAHKNDATRYDISTWLGESIKKKPLNNKTSDVNIAPEHLYRGYGYGIIRSITNTGIVVAEENIRTTCSTAERERLAKTGDQIEHPYKKLWQNSPYFSEYDFWKEYLTYVQLFGEFYIYMNRKPIAGATRYKAGTRNLMFPTNYMKLIRPTEMKAEEWDDEGNVTVWRRTRKDPRVSGRDLVQMYPAYQIIRIAEFNPLIPNRPYSLLDASKENLFTLENAKDFTRHALVANVNAPGIISVNGEFANQEAFDNYVAQFQNHAEGEWIVAAGNAETKAQELSQNLDGASQEKIRSVERDEMLVTSGVSKSILGIETTGLTRDVAATQKLTFVEKTVIPYIKLMIETLNFDYRVNYAGDFNENKYILRVTTPSTSDKAQELKELEVREEEYAMVQRYVDRGYTRKSAAQFVRGEIDVEQLQLERGDKAKLSPKESVELVDSAERWENLISAGNDPKTVIDLIEGRITMAEFIERNQDVVAKPTETDEPKDDDGDTDKRTPDEYYDPDPEDYGTPRDEKETPADKKKKEEKFLKQLVGMANLADIPLDENALTVLAKKAVPNMGLHTQTEKKLIRKAYSLFETAYSTEKQQIMLQTYRELQKDAIEDDQKALEFIESPTLPKLVRINIQKNLEKIDYAKINAKVKV